MAIDTAAIGATVFKALGIFAYIIIGLLIILVAVMMGVWWNKKKRYCYEVRIKKEEPKDSGNLVEVGIDRGGIFLDKKTANRLFIIKGQKVGLSPDNLPEYQGAGKTRIVDVLQLSLKTFRFLGKPTMVAHSPLTTEYSVFDYDVAWATNEYDKLKAFEKKSMLDKLKDVLPMVFIFMLSVVLIYFFLNKFGVLTDLAHSMQGTADKLLEVAKSLQPISQQSTTLVGK